MPSVRRAPGRFPKSRCSGWGDIVEYQIRKNGSLNPIHIGIFDRSRHRVESKWGDAGHVFLHDLWAVPAEYGDHVSFYRHVFP